jgi:hypothetical protein
MSTGSINEQSDSFLWRERYQSCRYHQSERISVGQAKDFVTGASAVYTHHEGIKQSWQQLHARLIDARGIRFTADRCTKLEM